MRDFCEDSSETLQTDFATHNMSQIDKSSESDFERQRFCVMSEESLIMTGKSVENGGTTC